MKTATTAAAPALAFSGNVNAALANVANVRNALCASFFERDAIVEGMLDALVAGEHCLLLGDPGTGKSDLIRALAGCLSAPRYEYLFGAYTQPDEVFGPVKIKLLAEQDRLSRNTVHRLPEAVIAFLDEVFKANNKLLNMLLPTLNERVFFDDGQVKPIPLRFVCGASNELPAAHDESLRAFDDRLLVRFVVKALEEESNVQSLFFAPRVACTAKMSMADVDAVAALAAQLPFADKTKDAIVALRFDCRAAGLKCSERKWLKALKVLRARAARTGATSVNLRHLGALENILWTRPDELPKVQELLNKHGAAWIRVAQELGAAVEQQRSALAAVKGKNMARGKFIGEIGLIQQFLEEMKPNVEALRKDSADDAAAIAAKIDAVLKDADTALTRSA